MNTPQPLTFQTQVNAQGSIEIALPLPVGQQVTVVVLPGEFDLVNELLKAANSALGFWDNPLDDEDWNNA